MITKDLGMVTAYAYAVAGGYTGTEAEFTQLMADLAIEVDEFENFSVVITGLPAGSAPTASYENGVLSLGIPKGDKGDQGDQGIQGETGATPQLSIGTVTTLPPTGQSSVTIRGTAENPILDFELVKGDTGEVSQADLDEAVTALKAEITQNGVVAGSNGLVSDSKISDSVPYTFRQTADGQRVGNVLYEEIVGGTVAFNQLVTAKNDSYGGITIEKTDTATERIYGTATVDAAVNISSYVYFQKDHVYLIAPFDGLQTSADGKITLGGLALQTTNGGMFKNTPNYTGGSMRLDFKTGFTIDYTGKPQMFDLTAMFGTTIADHLYALETATAGAGVAVFRKMFPNSYYPYNSGELLSVSGLSEHKMVGKNQLNPNDSNYGNYTITSTGEYTNGTDRIASDYMPCLPNTNYFLSGINGANANSNYVFIFIGLAFFDADKNFISRNINNNVNTLTCTSPANAKYMRWFEQMSGVGRTLTPSVFATYQRQLEFGSSATAHEPYVKHTYALDSTLTLRGVPKLSDGKIYYDGDVYKSDGSVTRKYGIVDLGSLTWGTSDGFFESKINDRSNGGAVCAKYEFYGTSPYPTIKTNLQEKQFAFTSSSSYKYIEVKDSSYSSASDFKTAMSGVYLVYELATSTTESADPYTNPQIVDRYGTEEYVTTGIVPIGHNSKYSEDLKGKLEELPWNFSALIAPTETAYKATRNYTTGGLLIVNNILYKVTANIANDGNIVPNTNVVATTLSEVIASL